MALPKGKYYVEVKRGKRVVWQNVRAGATGGIINSLEFALARKVAVLRAYPDAQVRIFRSETNWVEVELD